MEPIESPDIGQYLRNLRQLAKLSLREVARRSGVSNPYLSQVERGQRRPGPNVLKRLAPVYGVRLQELMERAGHLPEPAPRQHEAEQVEWAFQCVMSDPDVRIGARPEGELSLDAKRFIVHVYEQTTGRRLLDG